MCGVHISPEACLALLCMHFIELEHLAEPAVSPSVINSSAEKEHIQLASIFHT